MMTLSKRLFELIAKHMSRPGHISDAPPEADFVMSGLRAAGSANLITRRKILSDVSEDLEFLFTEFSTPMTATANYEIMVPDFQSQLLAVAE
jgi:hypothetical protein